MRPFLSPRRHDLQILILCFFALTLYLYLRMSTNDSSSVIAPGDVSESAFIRDVNDPNIRNASPQSSKAAPLSSLSTNATAPRNSAPPTGSTSTSPPQGLQPLERPFSLFRASPTTPGTQPTVTNENNTIRAIYQGGYNVSAQGKCPKHGEDMDLVIVITSRPSHTAARTAIRQTWVSLEELTNVSAVFMLGTTEDPELEKLLQDEQKWYGDLIRGRFLDSYSNLTLKTISTLEWVDTYCSNAKFLLKTDDDIFINIPRLLSFVEEHEGQRNVIFGKLAHKWKPFRDEQSKYYISSAQYKPVLYPDFMTGPAYLLSGDVINKLYESALNQTFFNLEDVFITGMVAPKLRIDLVHVNEFWNDKISYTFCNVQRVISIHDVEPEHQALLQKMLVDSKTKCKFGRRKYSRTLKFVNRIHKIQAQVVQEF
ncbi:beta-1,3-galactosyltransferase 5 isoform X2 [Diachasma alloeum]|uniref:beta-1,3-galactosyltransferase 5 isoform X2 n=1 Tax=Diachasma alloeum TaxID=454923 RepID=UPI000738345E|nr:beta-1,3-galactosyltransferase 5 isoform X2 [Diachasma alloeum]